MFSRTVRFGIRLYIWKIYPRCFLLYSESFFSVISSRRSPSIVILPSSAPSIPPMIFSNVDLPDPDGPSKTQNSPFSIFRSSPFNTFTRLSPVPNDFLIPLISRNIVLLHSYIYITNVSLNLFICQRNHFRNSFTGLFQKNRVHIHIKKGWRPAYVILSFPSPGSRLLLYILLYRNDCFELITVDLNIKFSSQCFHIGTYDCKSQSVTLTGSCLVAS